jgi:cysteine-rich repeat protein
MLRTFATLLIALSFATPALLLAQSNTVNTILTLSICGNLIVDDGEECDVPGETGVYSQTIAGRQCSATCFFGPYCGDGILQTQFGEECDDGNNDDGDFCSAVCLIEPAGSGGGGSSGGGGRSGGSNTDLGDTVLNVTGTGYPGERIEFLIDSEDVGSVTADNDGDFEFATDVSPGTVTLGLWASDGDNTRSVTLNNTFDVTQGAVTNINGIILPPSISVSSQNIDPGTVVTVTGFAVPDATIEIEVDGNLFDTTESNDNGRWSFELDTSQLSIDEHLLRARSVSGNPPLTSRSNYSSSLQLFVGVEGSASTPSDLNRDGSVNLIDFSILIFWWQTSGGDSDPPADINGNGSVSLEDFSILLFNWTG